MYVPKQFITYGSEHHVLTVPKKEFLLSKGSAGRRWRVGLTARGRKFEPTLNVSTQGLVFEARYGDGFGKPYCSGEG